MPMRRTSIQAVLPRQSTAIARSLSPPSPPARPEIAAMMTSPSPPPSDEAAVCCMCGDHGLPRELFRCRYCRVRLQHSYCSELYPRATSYRRCNWCLRGREKPAQAGGAAAYGDNKPAAESKRKASNDEGQRRHHEGCSSRRPPAEPGCPVKKRKRRKADDEIRAPPDAGMKGSCGNAGECKEVMMRAGKARVKVRRYKLLAEVISC